MPGHLIVLNGSSSSGKTSIAKEMQSLWPRPLQITGIDDFISGWPQKFITGPGDDGSLAAYTGGLRIVRGNGPEPSWIPEPGAQFLFMMELVHRAWQSIAAGGQDLVVDHVLIHEQLREDALRTLVGASWIGVKCDTAEVVRRERVRGDRHVGFASGTLAEVHIGMPYDLVVDTSARSSEACALDIVTFLRRNGNVDF